MTLFTSRRTFTSDVDKLGVFVGCDFYNVSVVVFCEMNASPLQKRVCCDRCSSVVRRIKIFKFINPRRNGFSYIISHG